MFMQMSKTFTTTEIEKYIIELDDLCPLKTLRDRKRSDPSFYALKEILIFLHLINYIP